MEYNVDKLTRYKNIANIVNENNKHYVVIDLNTISHVSGVAVAWASLALLSFTSNERRVWVLGSEPELKTTKEVTAWGFKNGNRYGAAAVSELVRDVTQDEHLLLPPIAHDKIAIDPSRSRRMLLLKYASIKDGSESKWSILACIDGGKISSLTLATYHFLTASLSKPIGTPTNELWLEKVEDGFCACGSPSLESMVSDACCVLLSELPLRHEGRSFPRCHILTSVIDGSPRHALVIGDIDSSLPGVHLKVKVYMGLGWSTMDTPSEEPFHLLFKALTQKSTTPPDKLEDVFKQNPVHDVTFDPIFTSSHAPNRDAMFWVNSIENFRKTHLHGCFVCVSEVHTSKKGPGAALMLVVTVDESTDSVRGNIYSFILNADNTAIISIKSRPVFANTSEGVVLPIEDVIRMAHKELNEDRQPLGSGYFPLHPVQPEEGGVVQRK